MLKENIEDQDLDELFENLFDNDEHFVKLMAKCVVP
jgi:hypothetical protein